MDMPEIIENVFPEFSAKQEKALFGPLYSRRGVQYSAVKGAMTRQVHVRLFGVKEFLHCVLCDCCVTDTDIQQCSTVTYSSGAFSVGGHAHAHILRPAHSQDCSDWI